MFSQLRRCCLLVSHAPLPTQDSCGKPSQTPFHVNTTTWTITQCPTLIDRYLDKRRERCLFLRSIENFFFQMCRFLHDNLRVQSVDDSVQRTAVAVVSKPMHVSGDENNEPHQPKKKFTGFVVRQVTLSSRLSLYNLVLLTSLNMYCVLTGGWLLLLFENFRAEEKDLAKVRKLADRKISAILPAMWPRVFFVFPCSHVLFSSSKRCYSRFIQVWMLFLFPGSWDQVCQLTWLLTRY